MKLTEILTSPEVTNDFFRRWSDLSETERLSFIRALKEVGKLSLSKVNQKTNNFCAYFDYPLVKPCAMKNCGYFLNNTELKNCICYALENAKNNRLTVSEIAKLLEVQNQDVNAITLSAINKIKHSVIKEKLEAIQPIAFHYLSYHCVHCDTYIKEDMQFGNVVQLDDQYAWCSEQCRQAKPKWQFLIEREFGREHKLVLAVALGLYKKHSAVDHIFGLPTGITKGLSNQLKAMVY